MSAYEIIEAMCELDSDEVMKSIPEVLFGNVALYCSGHVKYLTSYEEALNALHLRYSIAGK